MVKSVNKLILTEQEDSRYEMRKNTTVAEQRNYSVLDVNAAKQIALIWLQAAQLENVIGFGLPEVDDRYHIWRVPLLNIAKNERIGEVVIDARTSLILKDKSTDFATLETRLLGRSEKKEKLSSLVLVVHICFQRYATLLR